MENSPDPGAPRRRDRLIREREHDPYRIRGKLPEPTVCETCKAVYRDGRWQWAAIPDNTGHSLCQACARIRDDFPAGIVRLGGAFAKSHRAEIVNLARRQEALEKDEHPLNRIMDIGEESGELVIRTTDIHLPRRIGEAVHRAYSGELKYHYDAESYFLRVAWRRDS